MSPPLQYPFKGIDYVELPEGISREERIYRYMTGIGCHSDKSEEERRTIIHRAIHPPKDSTAHSKNIHQLSESLNQTGIKDDGQSAQAFWTAMEHAQKTRAEEFDPLFFDVFLNSKEEESTVRVVEKPKPKSSWDFIDDEGRKFWRRIAKEQNKNATDEEAKTCFESFDTEKWCKDSLEDEPQFFSLSSSKP